MNERLRPGLARGLPGRINRRQVAQHHRANATTRKLTGWASIGRSKCHRFCWDMDELIAGERKAGNGSDRQPQRRPAAPTIIPGWKIHRTSAGVAPIASSKPRCLGFHHDHD